jgi:hypothetical protein
MTKHSPGARAEDRCDPDRLRRLHAVADRVHAVPDRVQPSILETVIHRAAADAHRKQLRPPHATVLPIGELRDQVVHATRPRFVIYSMLIRGLVRHATKLGARMRTRGLRM